MRSFVSQAKKSIIIANNPALKFFRILIPITYILLVTGVLGYSQSPAYFVLGEKELANTDIYSINQGEDERLFIATNQGLLKYSHGHFLSIPKSTEQQGRSLFNLTRDQNNDLFCSNLQNQIFKLVNGKLELFYELKQEYIGTAISFSFDANNELIIGARAVINYSNGKEEVMLQSTSNRTYEVSKLQDNQIIITTLFSDSIFLLEQGILRYHHLPSNNHHGFSMGIFRTVCLRAGAYLSLYSDGAITSVNNEHFQNNVPAMEKERHYQFTSEEIWALGLTSGVRVIQLDDRALDVSETLFNNRFISAIATGKNSSMFFGTFGQGLLVVPNRNTLQHSISITDNRIRGIAADDKGNVFLAQRGKGILHYNWKASTLHPMPVKTSNKIFYTPEIDYGLDVTFPSLLFDADSTNGIGRWLGSVKNVSQLDQSTVLMATSDGIHKKGKREVLNDKYWIRSSTPGFYKLLDMEDRCQAVQFDQNKSKLYVATYSNLLSIDSTNHKEELLFNGKAIACNDLLLYNGELWCATKNKGILIYRDGTFVRQIGPANGLGDPQVNQFKLNNAQLFISTNTGFQLLNLTTQKWSTLGKAEGIVNGYVNDFTFGKDRLWILSNNTVLSMDLEHFPTTQPILELYMDSLMVSGNAIDMFNSERFTYDQNHFSFHIDFRSIEYESQSTIQYRITGLENEWNSTSASTPQIEYKSLLPGTYTFEAFVRYANLKSETISYPFHIAPPYWQTWWFSILLALGLSGTITLVFIYRIHRVRKKDREKLEKQTMEAHLLESQLKALKSQMNPHFIFNSLNSIQDLILQQDTDASYDYIVLFAELVRNTLNYSDVEFIPMDKELEFLGIYLSLEKLRFKDEFSYTIIYNDSKDIEVPSMIVQPFIENALQHGLLHKSGHKNLAIEFSLEEQLTCSVTDNGVGRKRAKEIQVRQGQQHESFALDAIKKRLSILTEQYGTTVGYEIEDLYENEEPLGTRVLITMPYSNLY